MAKQTILVGAAGNDRTGDPLRSAFIKANANFTELYNMGAAQGVQGITGAQGTQGIQGRQGIQGITGAQGVQGITGAGTQGTQGMQGAAGFVGSNGSQGAQGIEGSQGLQGAQGIEGSQGAQGIEGSQGAQGIEGSQGAQGIEGSQGLQGAQGTEGSQGAQGIQGLKPLLNTLFLAGDYYFQAAGSLYNGPSPAGMEWSAGQVLSVWAPDAGGIVQHISITSYDSADGTLVATITDSSNPGYKTQAGVYVSLSGQTGAQGLQGIEGSQGTQGIEGSQGLQGTQGIEGSQGAQGTEGSQGLQGAQGIEGSQGTEGAQGAQGTEGAQGLQGIQGIRAAEDRLINGSYEVVLNATGELTFPSVVWNYLPTTFTSVLVTYGETRLTFTVQPDNTFTNMSVAVGAGGYGPDSYNLTIPGTTFPGGATPANDIVFNVQTFESAGPVYSTDVASTVTYVSGTPPARYDNVATSDDLGLGAGSQHWVFKNNGAVVYPSDAIPSTSNGAAGDAAGSVVFGPSYIYYCVEDYSDGTNDIWKRVAWSNDTW